MWIKSHNLLKILGVISNSVVVGTILLILLFAATACISTEDKNRPDIGQEPDDVAYHYVASLKDQKVHEAYTLTTEEFRANVPEQAYSMSDIVEMMTERLVSFKVGELEVNGDRAKVEIHVEVLNLGAEEPVSGKLRLLLLKEDDSWRVDLSSQDFLPWKLEDQPPLAVFEYKGVSVSLKYILLYGATENTDPHTRLCLFIQNNSEYTLQWVLPAPGTTEGYIKDMSTGKMYLMLGGGGTKHKTGEEFDFFGGDAGFLLAEPGSEGSIYIHLEYVPETVEKFDMVLTGFHFPDTGEDWNVIYSDVPFRYDVAPD